MPNVDTSDLGVGGNAKIEGATDKVDNNDDKDEEIKGDDKGAADADMSRHSDDKNNGSLKEGSLPDPSNCFAHI